MVGRFYLFKKFATGILVLLLVYGVIRWIVRGGDSFLISVVFWGWVYEIIGLISWVVGLRIITAFWGLT